MNTYKINFGDEAVNPQAAMLSRLILLTGGCDQLVSPVAVQPAVGTGESHGRPSCSVIERRGRSCTHAADMSYSRWVFGIETCLL